jgi:type II secretory pathway pseudopilin PulG
MKPNSSQSGSRHEEGFLLLGVLFMILLIMMALAIAAPKMAESIRRDKEIETVHRGQQYARAIKIYYAKYGRYPNTIDQLVKSDNQRFLRKRYLNPMTGKDDWRIIHYGEWKVPAQGLFGQTIQSAGGITPTGATPGTGTGASSPFGSSSSPFGSSQSSPGTGNSSLGSSGSGFGSSGSGFGSSGSSSGAGSSTSPFSGTSGSPFGNSGTSTSPIGGTDPSSGSGFGAPTGTSGTTTTGANGTSTPIGGTQTTGSSGAFGTPGVSVGGAPIAGVGLMSKNTSIKIYRKQDHYNMWEFVFDNTQMGLDGAAGGVATGATGITPGTGANGAIGNGAGSGTNSGAGGFNSGTGSGFGSSNGSGFGSTNGSGFGSTNGSGFGGSPTSPVSPTSPTSNSPQ